MTIYINSHFGVIASGFCGFSLRETWTSVLWATQNCHVFFDLHKVWFAFDYQSETFLFYATFLFFGLFRNFLRFFALFQRDCTYLWATRSVTSCEVKENNKHMWPFNLAEKLGPFASEQRQFARSRLSSACCLFLRRESHWINIYFWHQLPVKLNLRGLLAMYWINL